MSSWSIISEGLSLFGALISKFSAFFALFVGRQLEKFPDVSPRPNMTVCSLEFLSNKTAFSSQSVSSPQESYVPVVCYPTNQNCKVQYRASFGWHSRTYLGMLPHFFSIAKKLSSCMTSGYLPTSIYNDVQFERQPTSTQATAEQAAFQSPISTAQNIPSYSTPSFSFIAIRNTAPTLLPL